MKEAKLFEQILEDIYHVQAQKDMTNHRAMFHMILSTRPSKNSQSIIDSGAELLVDYFQILGHQVVAVPHYGSENNCMNYHYHIALTPISLDGKRLLDQYDTYNNIINYLNHNSYTSWSWAYTTPTNAKNYL